MLGLNRLRRQVRVRRLRMQYHGPLYCCGCGCPRQFTAGYGWDGRHGPDLAQPTGGRR